VPHISREELEIVREAEIFDRLEPKPEAKPKQMICSDNFDWKQAAKTIRAADDPENRGRFLLGQLAICLSAPSLPIVDLGASLMRSLKPRSGLETLLLSQMAAVHAIAMQELSCASSGENVDIHTARATRLLRTFVQQVEALQVLRSRGRPQRVIVKHVNVNVAGQAIMGNVTAVPRGLGKNEQ